MNRSSALVRLVLTLAVIAVAAGSLSACGRKGKPIPPDGATYNKPYPRS
ncbi:lipoprotein [Novispirillum itersonii]|nr:lipoprotein [Novispirillum itersonii]